MRHREGGRCKTDLGFDGDLQLLLQQPFPVETAVPLVLHHAAGPPGGLAQPLALVDLEQLAYNIFRGLVDLELRGNDTRETNNALMA